MALSQVGSSSTVEASGTALALPVPASLATDDLIIACVKLFNTAINDVISMPAGFTEIPEAHVVNSAADATSDNAMFRCYYKRFAGESGNYAVSWTHSDVNQAACDVIRGAPTAAQGDPIDHAGVATATTTYTGSLPSGTQTFPTSSASGLNQTNEMVVAFCGTDQGHTLNTNGTMNLRQNQLDMAALDIAIASAGPSASQTMVQSGGTDWIWAAIPVVLTSIVTGGAVAPPFPEMPRGC